MLRTLLITVALVAASMSGCRTTTAHRTPCCAPASTVVGVAPVAGPACCPTPGAIPPPPGFH